MRAKVAWLEEGGVLTMSLRQPMSSSGVVQRILEWACNTTWTWFRMFLLSLAMNCRKAGSGIMAQTD